MPMPGPKQFTLADVAAQFARIDSEYDFFHAKVFCYIPQDSEKFANFLTGVHLPKAAFPNLHPASIFVGKLGNLVPIQSSQVMFIKDGGVHISAQLSPLKLPDCDYLAIMSPVDRTGKNYQLPIDSINFLRSLLSLASGKLPFYIPVAEFDFDANGTIAVLSGVMRMPLYGDLFTILDVGLINEITTRLALQQAEFRQRFDRACNFFNMALDQKDEAYRFSSYWIALEIIVGGTSDAIRSKLSKAYGKDAKTFADEKLLFREIENIRHDLMHKGLFGILASYQERLLQLYFWDIVIYQIGLKPRGLAMTFARSGMIEAETNRVPTDGWYI